MSITSFLIGLVVILCNVFLLKAIIEERRDYAELRNTLDDWIWLFNSSEDRVYVLNDKVMDLLLEIQEKDAIIKELEDEINANTYS